MKRFPLFVLSTSLLTSAPLFPQEAIDDDVIARIRIEGFQHSRVMEMASEMTDLLGPRLTGSRDMRRAQQWAAEKMRSMGLDNVSIEPFAEHGSSWDNDYTSLHLIEPDYQPLIGYPYAFTPGTDGRLRAPVKAAVIRRRADFDRYRGQLSGYIVLSGPPAEIPPRFDPDAKRASDEELAAMNTATIAMPRGIGQDDMVWDERIMAFVPPEEPDRFEPLQATREEIDAFTLEVEAFYKAEGVALILDPAPGRDGTVFVAGRPGSRYDRSYASMVAALPRVALAAEHYNRIFRLVSNGHGATVEAQINNALGDGAKASNVFGDLRGGDLADQLVMAGGHFDSWHSSTGATDDAAGCAVVLEALRILQAVGVQPRRTIRAALWSWEEGGKVGSRAYFDTQFTPGSRAHGRISAYFGQDNGSGQYRGIYLGGNDRVRPIFQAWMQPFSDLGMTALTINNSYGTDHGGIQHGRYSRIPVHSGSNRLRHANPPFKHG